jgi:hypothetical protein
VTTSEHHRSAVRPAVSARPQRPTVHLSESGPNGRMGGPGLGTEGMRDPAANAAMACPPHMAVPLTMVRAGSLSSSMWILERLLK